MGRKKQRNEQKYKSDPRRVCLLIGTILAVASFAIAATIMIMLFVPHVQTPPNQTVASVTRSLCIAGIVISCVGTITSVAGANSKKWLARLDFFMVIVSFFISCGMLITSSLGVLVGNLVNTFLG